MDNKISVTEGALLRGAEAVSGAHVDIADSTRRVLSELDQIQSVWSGDAAKAYTQMVSTWTANAQRINDTLTHLETALRATHSDQAAVEQSHQSTIRGLGSLMGGE